MRFKSASGGEILAYFMVTSEPFKRFWGKVVDLYHEKNLHLVELEKVARMILGQPPHPKDRFLAQIINGPFDIDKLDYLPRDGYHTGLRLDIDVDRLLLAMDVWDDKDTASRILTIDISGVGALEQLLFCKMMIFTSVYHHHAVRSSLHSLFRVLDWIMEGPGIKGIRLADPTYRDEKADRPYPNPFSFLLLDDHDILRAFESSDGMDPAYSAKLNQLVSDLKGRRLLKRALVLSLGTLEEDGSASEFARLSDPENHPLVKELRREIAEVSELPHESVVIDVPKPPRFEAISAEARVRLSRDRTVVLEKVFPTRGWVTGYAEFKNRVYIFSPEEARARVGQRAVEVLRKFGIKVKQEALELAKQDNELVRSVFPLVA